MEIIDWLIALVPVLSFGLVPVIGTLIGGKPVEQSMGVSLGGFLFAVILLIFHRPEFTPHIFLIGFLSGVFWAVGSIGQFQGIQYMGVARATPLLNGGQIIGTSLVGVMLGDWASHTAKIFGFSALALIIVGIIFTSYKENTKSSKTQWGKGVFINILAALGFTAYVGILKYYNMDSWSTILPQSVGQIVTVFLIGLFLFKTNAFTKFSVRNSVVGLIWGIGNITLLLSQAKLGLAVAYPVSQASVIVAVVGGIFLNKERKTKKEWISTVAGILIICAGLFLIYLSGKY